MALTDLIPWSRNRSVALSRFSDDSDPFLSLHREMNRMFDDFARGFGFGVPSRLSGSAWGSTWPRVEIDETDKEVRVIAKLPGLEQKDVEVTLADGVLTLKGEKKVEAMARSTANAGRGSSSARLKSARRLTRTKSTRPSRTAS